MFIYSTIFSLKRALESSDLRWQLENLTDPNRANGRIALLDACNTALVAITPMVRISGGGKCHNKCMFANYVSFWCPILLHFGVSLNCSTVPKDTN